MSASDPSTRRPGPFAGALAILCLFAVSGTPFVAAAPTKSGPWVELGRGSDGNFLWTIKAKNGEGQTREGLPGAQQPCLLAAASWQTGQLEYHRSKFRQCAPVSSLRRSGSPLLATAMRSSGGAPALRSAVGMIFAPAARRVRVTFAGGGTKTIRLRDVGQDQVPGLGHLRYTAFAIHGAWCAERLVSLGAGGRALWDSGVDDYQCGAAGPPNFASPAKP